MDDYCSRTAVFSLDILWGPYLNCSNCYLLEKLGVQCSRTSQVKRVTKLSVSSKDVLHY